MVVISKYRSIPAISNVIVANNKYSTDVARATSACVTSNLSAYSLYVFSMLMDCWKMYTHRYTVVASRATVKAIASLLRLDIIVHTHV
jgi:hypothetical protein